MAQVRVSSQSELLKALQSADEGTVILLERGHYGNLNLSNLNFSDFVTIKSADGNGGATFGSIALNGVSHLRFDDVAVVRSGSANANNVSIQNSKHIQVVNSEIHGSNDGNYMNDGTGLFARNSSNIVVEGNTFHDLKRAACFNTVDGVNAGGNEVFDIRHDGFNFAAVRNAVIENNSMTGFHSAPGDHNDFIQFWSAGTSRPSENVVIRGNVLLQDGMDRVHGIYVQDEVGNLAPRNFVIEDNIVYSGSPHGITVSGGRDIAIQNNTVLTNPHNGWESKIYVRGDSANIDVHNNVMTGIVVDPGARADVSGNVIAQWQDPNGKNFYGDLFVDAMTGNDAGDFAPKAGSILDGGKIGASISGGTGSLSPEPDPDPEVSPTDPTPIPDPVDSVSGGGGTLSPSVPVENDSPDSGSGGSGWDIVRSSVTYGLDANEEQLNLTGSDAINGFGNGGRNVLVGNGADNTLKGFAGDDNLYGASGNDILIGGAGEDLIFGGGGYDRLAGGGGSDVFRFYDSRDSAPGSARDKIFDFDGSRGDVIDLSRIDANTNASGNQDFHYIGSSAFQGKAGELRYDGGILAGDVTGDARADFEVQLVGSPSVDFDDFTGV